MDNGIDGTLRARPTRETAVPSNPSKRTFATLRPYAWGIAAPTLCTLLIWPMRNKLGSSSLLLMYLLGVFLVAAQYGRTVSFLASIASAGAFAYFFAPPIFSLAVADTENIIALGAMLIVAHITGRLVETLRLQADIAAQREQRTAALYRLIDALARARHENEVLGTAVHHLHLEFGMTAVILFPDAESRMRYPKAARLPESLQGADLQSAGRVLSRGDAVVTQSETEGTVAFLPLDAAGGCIGVLAVASPDTLSSQPWTPEHSAFLDMFRTQIAQALERSRLAEQAKQASVQAEAEALRNSLLSAISHDLRTPLTRIMGAAGILAERERLLNPDERWEFNKSIQDEAERMSDLMSKILDMARIAAGTIVLHREWNTVEEIVGGTLTRLEKMLDDRPVNIHLSDDVPLLWVDAVLLQQVLSNLIENAIKYTPSGSAIEITAERLFSGVRLAVADRGPGIPVGLEDKVFEKFYRFESESTRSGAGLGLALCRAIVDAHDGGITAANRPDGGAVFTLALPVREPPAIALEDESEP
jgi:two-component system sensor histidine kinase KdpD